MKRLEIVLTVFAVSFYVLCLSATALADEERALAAANLSPLKPERSNGDYLKAYKGAPETEKSLNRAIFDKPVADEMSEKFNSFNSVYQVREAYGLNEREDYLRYQQANKDLAEWTLKKLLQYHFDHTLKSSLEASVKRAASSPKHSESRTAAKAVVAISQFHKAIQNTTLNLGKDMKTRFRYDYPSGMVRFGMTSPLLEASMDYQTKPTAPPSTVGTVDVPEKLSFGVSKNFDFARASTDVRYGLSNETLHYGFNKHLVGPLSAQVNQAHHIKNTSRDETLFRLNFGTRF